LVNIGHIDLQIHTHTERRRVKLQNPIAPGD
jgi:hypothetical protein